MILAIIHKVAILKGPNGVFWENYPIENSNPDSVAEKFFTVKYDKISFFYMPFSKKNIGYSCLSANSGHYFQISLLGQFGE